MGVGLTRQLLALGQGRRIQLKALWGGHTAALQFSIGHRDTVGPKKSRQCKIGDRNGADIEGGEHVLKKDDKSNAKLRIVMHNACISAINKREEGHRMATFTAFGNRVARWMGGYVFKRTRKENHTTSSP